eukprot:GHVP01041222.1.p1 GENE.GHVP01041222.1~~GHVP01041222.1.p1  ORF type:complete len:301 (-),score=51.85 GHVP01041222.1:71-973(-)
MVYKICVFFVPPTMLLWRLRKIKIKAFLYISLVKICVFVFFVFSKRKMWKQKVLVKSSLQIVSSAFHGLQHTEHAEVSFHDSSNVPLAVPNEGIQLRNDKAPILNEEQKNTMRKWLAIATDLPHNARLGAVEDELLAKGWTYKIMFEDKKYKDLDLSVWHPINIHLTRLPNNSFHTEVQFAKFEGHLGTRIETTEFSDFPFSTEVNAETKTIEFKVYEAKNEKNPEFADPIDFNEILTEKQKLTLGILKAAAKTIHASKVICTFNYLDASFDHLTFKTIIPGFYQITMDQCSASESSSCP